MMNIRLAKLDSTNIGDFYLLHSESNKMGQCFCTAWWVPTWDEWDNRTSEQNRSLRENLFRDGIYDGYLMYDDDRPIGWCQCGPRDRMPKIRQTYNLTPDPEVWAISCFFLLPEYREIGLAQYFLDEIIKNIKSEGVWHLQGFPCRGKNLTADDIWTGPENIFQKAGFNLEIDNDRHPVYYIKF
jgi:GNAT superfamily N-acetyltransferase